MSRPIWWRKMDFNIAHLQVREQPIDVDHPFATRVCVMIAKGLAHGKPKDDSIESIKEVKE